MSREKWIGIIFAIFIGLVYLINLLKADDQKNQFNALNHNNVTEDIIDNKIKTPSTYYTYRPETGYYLKYVHHSYTDTGLERGSYISTYVVLECKKVGNKYVGTVEDKTAPKTFGHHIHKFIIDDTGEYHETPYVDYENPYVESNRHNLLADLKYPIKLGNKWIDYFDSNKNYRSSEIIDTNSTVSTPIGTFENCIKIKREMFISYGDNNSGQIIETYHYYAPNIGLIKTSDTAETGAFELVQYGYLNETE